MNLGALGTAWSKATIAVVGAWYFPNGESQTGFLAAISGTPIVTENYVQVNDPHAPTPQQAYSINDLGQIVGDYIDSTNIFHAYELDGGQFKPVQVPFPGATGTFSPAINNSGEIVGGWYDSSGVEHSFTLVNGTYSSFDYPGLSRRHCDVRWSYQRFRGHRRGLLPNHSVCDHA